MLAESESYSQMELEYHYIYTISLELDMNDIVCALCMMTDMSPLTPDPEKAKPTTCS